MIWVETICSCIYNRETSPQSCCDRATRQRNVSQQTRSADTQSRDRLTSLSRCVNFVRPLMFAQGSARLAKCRKDRLRPTAETIHLFRLAKMSYKEVLGRARIRGSVAKRWTMFYCPPPRCPFQENSFPYRTISCDEILSRV